jgi:hypothetical protein
MLINNGDISNKGFEIGLNLDLISTDDIELSIGGNVAFNKTKILSLGIPFDDFYIDGEVQQRSFFYGNTISRGQYFRTPANVFVQGEESSLFYGFETNGIYQTEDTDLVSGAVPGDVRIVDQNGDGKIDEIDRTFIGNPNPDFIYGVNLNFRYKRLNMSMLFNGVQGNDIANGNLLTIGDPTGNQANITADAYYNAWRPDAQSNTHPRIGYDTSLAKKNNKYYCCHFKISIR